MTIELKEETKEIKQDNQKTEVKSFYRDSSGDEQWIPYGVHSFEALDAMEKANEVSDLSLQLTALAQNIANDSEVEDKPAALQTLMSEFKSRIQQLGRKEKNQPVTDYVTNKLNDLRGKAETKTEGGMQYPASDFAYVPDKEKSSTWKLRLSQGEPGNITKSQLGRAAAALSPGGFRGQKVQLPTSAVPGVKRRIRKEYKTLGVERADMPASVKQLDNSFSIKELEDGNVRWTAIYSNKFRDDDSPPEIISDASHRRFVEKVDNKEADYPELWYWHNKDWKIGQADFVAYDDRGFAIASGIYDNPLVGKAMMKHPELCNAVSHGMPKVEVKYDKEDSSIITEHITVEISPLPLAAAANKLTTFNIFSEVKEMAVTDEKRNAAKLLGIEIDEVEDVAEAKASEAEEQGLDSKEKDKKEKEQIEEVPITRRELEEVVMAMGATIKELGGAVVGLTKQVQELQKDDNEKIKEAVENTPAASLGGLFASVIGSDETKVDKRTKLAKDGPEEAESQKEQYPAGIMGHAQRINEEKMKSYEVVQ